MGFSLFSTIHLGCPHYGNLHMALARLPTSRRQIPGAAWLRRSQRPALWRVAEALREDTCWQKWRRVGSPRLKNQQEWCQMIIWWDCKDLTATSLRPHCDLTGIMVSKANSSDVSLISGEWGIFFNLPSRMRIGFSRNGSTRAGTRKQQHPAIFFWWALKCLK